MINAIVRLKQPGKKLINTIHRVEKRKMEFQKKQLIYRKFLGDSIESVNYQLKKVVEGHGEQLSIDGFTHIEQLM